MTTTFRGNETVQSGYYINLSRLAIEPVAENGGRLPAGPGTWKRIPTLAAILATPIVGLAFLMFLPMIGFVLCAKAVAVKLTGPATELAASVSPGMATGAAYMTGKEGEKAEEKAAPEVEKLAKEIEEKRKG